MDTKTVTIIGNIVKFGLGLVGVILCFVILFKGVEDGNDKYVDIAINLAIGGIIVAAVVALLFAIFYFITNIKSSIGALIGIGALVVVFIISYSMSSGVLMNGWADMGVTESISKMVGAGIYTFLILTGVAVVAALFTEVTKIIK